MFQHNQQKGSQCKIIQEWVFQGLLKGFHKSEIETIAKAV